MLILIANLLVIVGSVILISTLFSIQRLFNSLPSREIRAKKYFLIMPILFFILGYLGYLVTFWNAQKNWHDLLMPGVLFASACALWMTYKLSLQPIISFALEQGNITDSLTGLHNRSYQTRRLGEEVARAQRYALPLSIFLLDIDQFNKVNSAYGRQAGDQILIHLARLLLEYVRESDEVARYDHDAMLVMAANTSIQDAHLLAERIRQRVEIQPLLHTGPKGTERVAIQISMGVATLQGGFDSLEKLLQRAELALQQAKQAGGNCVMAPGSATTQVQGV
jgi:diguanylate cyclase (GGDEF)-like protein